MSKVHSSVELAESAILRGEVTIGENCKIGPYCILQGPLELGPGNQLSSHVVLGGDPQDWKYQGGGKLKIGSENLFREFVTVHRGHLSDTGTVIGNRNSFMCYSHIGHDCILGDQNTVTNGAQLAGHVEIGNHVNISGLAAFHQFCRIGDYAMISGLSAVRGDVYPYSLVQGDPAKQLGINSVGLKRKGFDAQSILKIKEAFRCLRNGIEPEEENEFYMQLEHFRQNSQRGMIQFLKGHR